MPLIDLHLHTTVSDGVWSPQHLLDCIRERAVDFFSITDHDTMEAYPLPKDVLERCVPGMEVDTKCDGATAHLLVYGVASSLDPLLQRLRAQRVARRERMCEMVERLRGLGVSVSMADVERQAGTAASLGRPHLARALVELGVVVSVQEAFDKYIADDRDQYVALERLESQEAIELAHASGAIVSIAHPCRLKSPAMIDLLRVMGADAIEVIHPTADATMRLQLLDYVKRHNLLATGGSDFHVPGGDLPGVELNAVEYEKLRESFAALVSGAEFDSRFAAERTDATAISSTVLE
jgi:predicted metal-dependent phosphoesterase TrpH